MCRCNVTNYYTDKCFGSVAAVMKQLGNYSSIHRVEPLATGYTRYPVYLLYV